MQTRKYSSISQDTTLAAGGISSTATTMTVATGTGSFLMGGITLTTGSTFQVAIDPDTVNEELVFITAQSGDVFTITRARAGTSGVAHAPGAVVRHVMSSDDLNYFNTTSPASLTTAKGDIVAGTGDQAIDTLPVGTNGQVLVADSTQTTGLKWATAGAGDVTLNGTQTLSNKTLKSPKESVTASATAATGTVNFDAVSQGVLYYQNNATANFTLNFRGNSTTTLNSLLAVGEGMTLVFLNTNGTTAYRPTAFQIDGTSVTPKWQGGIAPSAGNASSIDSYVFAIIKTASTPTYTVLASQTKFA